MNESELSKILEDLKSLILPKKETLAEILTRATQIFEKEENLIEIEGECIVIGDLHGHFFDFLNILDLIDSNQKLIFLGDYVDRGFNSVELIIYLMVMKISKPEKTIILRGNHENKTQTTVYGFREECIEKYDLYTYWMFCELFEYFPIAVIVNQKYFCVHGGIQPDLTLDWIKNSDRIQEFSELSSLFWGDPSNDVEYFTESSRGAGYLYGHKAVQEFLDRISCEYLVRSHQLVFDGIEEKFDGQCITVWSAPNYCYKCKNIAAVIKIESSNHEYIYFKAVETQHMQSEKLQNLYFSGHQVQ